MDDDFDVERFADHLIWAEGFRNFPYEDSVGKLTIGVGRNLDDVGLDDDEVLFLLRRDIDRSLSDCRTLPYWDRLSAPRRLVIADMVFNLGLRRFRGFVRTNLALSRGQWETAADEMVDSKWYRQTGRRARRLVAMMRQDRYVEED